MALGCEKSEIKEAREHPSIKPGAGKHTKTIRSSQPGRARAHPAVSVPEARLLGKLPLKRLFQREKKNHSHKDIHGGVIQEKGKLAPARERLQRNSDPSPAHQCRGCYLPIKVAGLRTLSIAGDVCGR